MGVDDGDCDASPTGVHSFALVQVTPGGRGGAAMVDECEWCGATAYTPSAGDSGTRLPLD